MPLFLCRSILAAFLALLLMPSVGLCTLPICDDDEDYLSTIGYLSCDSLATHNAANAALAITDTDAALAKAWAIRQWRQDIPRLSSTAPAPATAPASLPQRYLSKLADLFKNLVSRT